jgi:hypothetical protein
VFFSGHLNLFRVSKFGFGVFILLFRAADFVLRIYFKWFAPCARLLFVSTALDRCARLTVTDADLAADDMGDQCDDDHDKRREKGDHRAPLKLPAKSIIERQQRHSARLAGTQ